MCLYALSIVKIARFKIAHVFPSKFEWEGNVTESILLQAGNGRSSRFERVDPSRTAWALKSLREKMDRLEDTPETTFAAMCGSEPQWFALVVCHAIFLGIQ